MPNVFAKNTTSASITVAGHKVYYIDSTDAEIVEVEGTSLSLYLNPWKSAESVTDTGMFGAGYTLYLGDGSVYNEGNIPGFIAAYNGDTSISDFENRLELIIRNGKVVLDGVGSYATWVSRIEVSNPVKYNAFKYLLSGTPYWYVIDGEHDTWTDDLSAWGYSEVPVGPVLPTVTVSDKWLVIGWNEAGNVTIAANGTHDTKVYNDSSELVPSVYDSLKVYAIIRAAKVPYSVVTRGGIKCEDVGGTIGVRNVTSSSISVYQAEFAFCEDTSVTVITVYDSSNNAYNAFKFTANNTDYYYVLDGTQTDWTDDLSSIGYSLTPTTKRGYAYRSMSYYGDNYGYLTYTAAGSDYIPPNDSKRYIVVSINSSPSFDASTIELTNNSSPGRLKATCYSPFNGSLWYVDYYEVDA